MCKVLKSYLFEYSDIDVAHTRPLTGTAAADLCLCDLWPLHWGAACAEASPGWTVVGPFRKGSGRKFQVQKIYEVIYKKVHMDIYIKNEQTGGEFDEWWGQENVSANKQNNLVCKVCWYPLLRAGAWPTDRHIPVTIANIFIQKHLKSTAVWKVHF